VVDYLAVQLGVADASVVKRYAERLPTQYEHAREIRDVYGFREFADVRASGQLREFWTGDRGRTPKARCGCSSRRWPGCAVSGCCCRGGSVLVRAVAAAREAAEARMHRTLAEAAVSADAELPDRLIGLLVVPDGQRFSELERLRRRGALCRSGRLVTSCVACRDRRWSSSRSSYCASVPDHPLGTAGACPSW
jgi:Domain of unknown function (DUF4158)